MTMLAVGAVLARTTPKPRELPDPPRFSEDARMTVEGGPMFCVNLAYAEHADAGAPPGSPERAGSG